MRSVECPREDELLAALQRTRELEACPAELQEHVAACASCASLADVVLRLLDEHHVATAHAPVPSAGTVWFRAQMRARHEAAQAAARPIGIVQAIGIACAVGLLAGGITLLSTSVGPWLDWFGDLGLPSIELASLEGLAPATLTVLVAATMVVILAPVAIYLSSSSE